MYRLDEFNSLLLYIFKLIVFKIFIIVYDEVFYFGKDRIIVSFNGIVF